MSASSVVMRGKRGMPVSDEGAKGGAAGRSGCRMHRYRGDGTQINIFYCELKADTGERLKRWMVADWRGGKEVGENA